MDTHTAIQVWAALRGRKVLVVGGDAREQALRRLQYAFELSDVIHCPTRRSDPSSRSFQTRVQDPTIALVVCVLGLSRTSHIKELHRLCRAFGLPWVDCFRIPHPHLLAAAVTDLHLLEALRRRIGSAS